MLPVYQHHQTMKLRAIQHVLDSLKPPYVKFSVVRKTGKLNYKYELYNHYGERLCGSQQLRDIVEYINSYLGLGYRTHTNLHVDR